MNGNDYQKPPSNCSKGKRNGFMRFSAGADVHLPNCGRFDFSRIEHAWINTKKFGLTGDDDGNSLRRYLAGWFWLIVCGIFGQIGIAHCPAQSPAEIYQQRILPLLAAGTNSCSECHLQGIDLQSVLSDDQEKTFADLRARGWIDIDNPVKSKFLKFIERHSESSTEIQGRVRDVELQAVTAWIKAACRDPNLLKQSVVKRTDLDIDEPLIRHSRIDQVTRRFTIAIWSQLERCANCHSPDRNDRFVKEHGEQMSWIVPQDPRKTLELLIERKLIDLDSPDDSILRSKPIGRVEHGAGTKFPEGGKTDRSWTAFLNDYAKIVRGEYVQAEDLPNFDAVHSWRSGLHLRIVDIPESCSDQIVTVTLHRILPTGAVQSNPAAIAECFVTKDRRRWGNSLILLDQRETIPAEDLEKRITLDEALPKGTYQLRMTGVGSKDSIGNFDSMMTTTIEAPWQSGHKSAATVDFKH